MRKPDRKKSITVALSTEKTFSLQFGNAQHEGARNYQEDYFGFSPISQEELTRKGVLAVLCDGMGGLRGGRETAVETVSTLLTAFQHSDFRYQFDRNIASVITGVNGKIHSTHNRKQFTTGCTLVLAYIYDNHLYWACVGDSRLYLIRGGRMYALNEDHDHYSQLMDRYIDGDLSWKSVQNDPQKDNLASFIGAKAPKIDVSHTGMSLELGDMLLLCSDGVYNSISECEILRYTASADAQTACDAIIRNIAAKGKPSQDNMTAMLIKVDYFDKNGKKRKI